MREGKYILVIRINSLRRTWLFSFMFLEQYEYYMWLFIIYKNVLFVFK